MVNNKQIVEVLLTARALIARPHGWTKYSNARQHNGEPTNALGPKATCFCSQGALLKAATSRGYYFDALYELQKDLPKGNDINVAIFNDTQATVEPVLALFDKTIERLKVDDLS